MTTRELVRDRVQEIAERQGVCTPAAYVESCRDSDDPLHKTLTWDDSLAGEKWRQQEARNLIRIVPLENGNPESPPAFVHVRMLSDEGVTEGYMPTRTALSGDTRAGVINEALNTLRGFKRRYSSLTELQPVWEAMESLEEEVAA